MIRYFLKVSSQANLRMPSCLQTKSSSQERPPWRLKLREMLVQPPQLKKLSSLTRKFLFSTLTSQTMPQAFSDLSSLCIINPLISLDPCLMICHPF
jgi:hypothetical protein